MSYYLTTEDVNKLNQEHRHHLDIYERNKSHTIGAIIYTRLTEVKNSTLFLEVYINDDWKKNNRETAIFFINEWLNRYEELNQCKFYRASIYLASSLGFTIHKDDNFDATIKQITVHYKPLKSKNTLQGIFSNIELTNLFQRVKKTFKPFPFTSTIYKLQVDLDVQFYSINLDTFIRLFTYDWEDYYYNNKYAGIPAVLKIEREDSDYIDMFPHLELSKLPNNSKYAVMKFKETEFSFSTKATSNIRGTELVSIEIYEFTHFQNVKLIAKANKKTLKQMKI